MHPENVRQNRLVSKLQIFNFCKKEKPKTLDQRWSKISGCISPCYLALIFFSIGYSP